jgi:hypothetical protein
LQRCHDGINQTAKRSVTRMSDHDPKERRKNELDPNTQLEKPTFVDGAANGSKGAQLYEQKGHRTQP